MNHNQRNRTMVNLSILRIWKGAYQYKKMEISKLTSQFVSGRSGSSKPRGERVRLKTMELCLNPELKTQNQIYFAKSCISVDGKHFLCKTKSIQTANTHISVVHESSSTDIWGFGKMHELIKYILPKVVISVDGKQFLCKTKLVQTHT